MTLWTQEFSDLPDSSSSDAENRAHNPDRAKFAERRRVTDHAISEAQLCMLVILLILLNNPSWSDAFRASIQAIISAYLGADVHMQQLFDTFYITSRLACQGVDEGVIPTAVHTRSPRWEILVKLLKEVEIAAFPDCLKSFADHVSRKAARFDISLKDPDHFYEALQSNRLDMFHGLHGLQLFERDYIVVRYMQMYSRNAGSQLYAKMSSQNVMSIYEDFFGKNVVTSIKNIKIVPEVTPIEVLTKVRGRVILHELFHSRSSISAADEMVRLECPEPESCSHSDHMAPAYGPFRCRQLVLSDMMKPPGQKRAKNNAESWAICGYLLLYTMAYPEFDFGGELVQRRDKLLHHFSGLDGLRNSRHGSIKHLAGYDDSQDLCSSDDWAKLPTERLADNIGNMAWCSYAKAKGKEPHSRAQYPQPLREQQRLAAQGTGKAQSLQQSTGYSTIIRQPEDFDAVAARWLQVVEAKKKANVAVKNSRAQEYPSDFY